MRQTSFLVSACFCDCLHVGVGCEPLMLRIFCFEGMQRKVCVHMHIHTTRPEDSLHIYVTLLRWCSRAHAHAFFFPSLVCGSLPSCSSKTSLPSLIAFSNPFQRGPPSCGFKTSWLPFIFFLLLHVSEANIFEKQKKITNT